MAKSKKSRSRSKSKGSISKRLDVRSSKDVPILESLIKKGPMIIVLVHADWCGHCQTFKDKVWNKVPNSSSNTINTASIHHDMLDKTSLSGAKLEGYPSLLLVGKDGKPAEYKNTNGESTNAMPQPATAEDLNKMVNTPLNNANGADNLDNANNVNNNANTNANTNTNSLSTASNILSMNSNSNSSASTTNSYKPAKMNNVVVDTSAGQPPSILDDLVQSQKQNRKQMGGNLYRSLLNIVRDQTVTKKRSHKKKVNT